MIDESYVKRTCRIGHGPLCCAFLLMGKDGFECAKDEAGLYNQINDRLAQGKMVAIGDNCPGWAVRDE